MENANPHFKKQNPNVTVEKTLEGALLISFDTGFKYPISKIEAALLAKAIGETLRPDLVHACLISDEVSE